jgi:hypothetical protein
MQPTPLLDTQKVSFQIPRNVLVRVWWRRTMFRPRRLIFSVIIFFISMLYFFMWPELEYVGVILLLFLIFMPIVQYRALAKAVDNDKILTDPKTLEFGESQLVLTGPDWKSEMPWTRFKGFSEDDIYFYFHLSDNGIASVIPKSAFSTDQQQQFRKYAQKRNT